MSLRRKVNPLYGTAFYNRLHRIKLEQTGPVFGHTVQSLTQDKSVGPVFGPEIKPMTADEIEKERIHLREFFSKFGYDFD